LPFGQRDQTLAGDATFRATLLDLLIHRTHVVPISGDSYQLEKRHQTGMVNRILPLRLNEVDDVKRKSNSKKVALRPITA
jgi:hypothetical protein